MNRLGARLLWNLVPTAMVCVILYLAVWGENGWLRNRELQAKLLKESRHLTVLREQNAGLSHEVARLADDPDAQERAAAEELLLVREHTTVFRFTPDPI
jgi:cell division protein FtsB